MSISSVTSESLQLKLRQLLPSQQGFGTDLSASDTIIPVIDLTAAAEGSSVDKSLVNAVSFSDQTPFTVNASTVVIANTSGFWRIFGMSNLNGNASAVTDNSFTMTDGLSVKTIWQHNYANAVSSTVPSAIQFDFIVWLGSGESISVTSNNALCNVFGSSRNVADTNGRFINPSGFTPS